MNAFLVVADSSGVHLAEAADRLAEAYLLDALRGRALADEAAREAAERERHHQLAVKRDLLLTDLITAFGVTTLSLLRTHVVDGQLDGDDARALLTYRYPYELRPDREHHSWTLRLLDDTDGNTAHGIAAGAVRPLIISWTMSERGAIATTTLWCAIADLAMMRMTRSVL